MKKSKQKKLLFMTVLLIMVGFAAVSTTLVLNGTLNLMGDIESFDADVIFTRAETEKEGSALIDKTTKKTITFTSKELSKVNESATLEFDITNKNRMYDAIATINCNTTIGEYVDYITVVPNKNEYEIGSSETVAGSLTATVIKAYDKEEAIDIPFTCNLEVRAQEREEIAPEKEKIIKVIKGDGTQLGDEICIGEECFYVLSNDGENVRMLAKYNLFVGSQSTLYNDYDRDFGHISYSSPSTNLQDKKMLGALYDSNGDLQPPFYPECYEGVTSFSYEGVKYEGSVVEAAVNNYVEKLKLNYRVTCTGDLIQKQDLDVIAGEEIDINSSLKNYNTIPEWIYATSYWTKTAYDEEHLINVQSNGALKSQIEEWNLYKKNNSNGVRPLITISTYYLQL